MAKKILALLLAVMMVAALATGCSDSNGSTSSGNEDTTPAGDAEVDLSVERSIKLVVDQNTFITDYEDNYLTNRLEEAFNCDITIENLPATDGVTKLQLMINGGDTLPDVFSTNNVSSALMYEYGSSGTFVALEDYYDNENVMPYYNAIESEEDKISLKAAATSADGHTYCLARFEPEEWNLTPYRMYINTTWLENLGLEMPSTTDELYDVLNAFANEDPNGNGTKDEIAVFCYYTDDGGGYGNNVLLPLMNSFVFTGTKMSALTLSEDGLNVMTPTTTDEWKEGLKYLRSLYDCGAISDASFAYDGTSFKGTLNWQGIGTEKAEPGKSINVVGLASLGSNSGQYDGSGTDSNNNFLEYWLMPVPTGPEGQAYSPYGQYSPSCNWFVTEDAADPAFCVMMGDYFYDFDMSLVVRFGEQDVDWTADPDWCAEWYAQHTQLIEEAGYTQPKESYLYVMINNTIWSDSTNHFWHNIQPRYMSLENFAHMGTYYDPETFVYYQANNLNPTNAEYYYPLHPQYTIPALSYTDDEQASITDFQIEFPELLEEWTLDFVTGNVDIDGSWDAYLAALEAAGLSNYLEVSQAAYERTVYYQANFQ